MKAKVTNAKLLIRGSRRSGEKLTEEGGLFLPSFVWKRDVWTLALVERGKPRLSLSIRVKLTL